MERQIWTIGHSTRSFEEFVDLLKSCGVGLLADVRRYPGSARHPHFNKEALESALPGAGIGYRHFPGLGGRRRPDPQSKNTAWRNEAFRGYADYMETPEFQESFAELASLAEKERAAMMCSESVWWRCHRSLISDLMKSEGYRVWHIMGTGKVQEHPYTGAAGISGGKLDYTGGQTKLF